MGFGDWLKNAASVAVAPGYLGYKYGKKAYDYLSKESDSAIEKRDELNQQGRAASGFAGVGEAGYGAMSAEAATQRDAFRRLASGQDSLSSEQLRQGLQQNMAAQRSMAASASPQNGPMAALMAAQNMGRMGAGMSGQAALAGIQERNAAQKALSDMILQQRQQDQQVALGSRQNAISGFGGITPDKSNLEKAQPFVEAAANGGAALAKLSDRREKTAIEDGAESANGIIAELRPYTYRYSDPKHGRGEELGIMAQDLEAAGLGYAVIERDGRKVVDVASLTTANTAMIAALGERVRELETRLRKAEGAQG